MAYSDESERIRRRLQAALGQISDQQVRQLTGAWVNAWNDVAPELQAALDELSATGRIPTRSQLIRSRRLAAALALVESRLADLFDQSAASTIDQLRAVVDAGGAFTDQMISSMLPPGVNVDGWSRVDPGQVDAIVQRSTEQITKLSFPLADAATATMKRELVRGMLVGSNPREAARRMLAKSRSTFNGGLSRALTIARTEMLDAQRAACALAEKQNVDVLECWIWTSALGSRTCPSCWAMHGTEHPLEEPGPSDHHCGRCTRVSKTKSWRDLGFDIDEPPSLLPDAEARFAALTVHQQFEILGPARFAAWKDGAFPMSAWAVKRSASGWRDSWVPAKPPAGYRLNVARQKAPGSNVGRIITGKGKSSTWFSHSADALSAASAEIRSAVRGYTGTAYLAINGRLRAHAIAHNRSLPMSEPDWLRETVGHLDAAMRLTPVTEAIKVHRVVEASDLGLASASDAHTLIGSFVTDPGFLSTARPGGKPLVTKHDAVRLEITIPAGVPAASISRLSQFPGEREVLIARGRTIFLSKPRYDQRLKLWRVNATVLPI